MENNKALTPTSRNDKHVRDRARLPLLILQAFQRFTGTGTPFKPSVKTDLATYSRCCLLVLSTCPFYLLSFTLSRCATEKNAFWIADENVSFEDSSPTVLSVSHCVVIIVLYLISS